ncbi:MBL fold metallo-hydrolase [Desulfurococcaceae archaeon MEX13E-LK6-19]|nr:MBL fold metallo-hydrolase [Desulfurococcaceae archaeon MEX13E-LK6-19]
MASVEIKVLGSGGEVGRAAIYVRDTVKKKGILLDYGVNFDEEGRPQFPEHIRPVDVAAVVVSHAHLDHIGAVPMLYISARPLSIMTKPTQVIGEILIKDFMKLSGYYIDYEEGEVQAMMDNSLLLDYGEDVDVNDYNILVTSAGHILGSMITYLTTPSGHKIMYTGDINTIQTWTLSKAELWPYKVDTLIIESTYGGVKHPPRYLVEKKLVEAVEEVINDGGTVLIPAFSVGRSQEVISLLAAELPHVPVYLDGMSREITEIYLRNKKFLRDPDMFRRAVENTRFIRGWEDRRKAWKRPCVIVSSAGMLKGGPALYYLKKLGSNEKNAVFLVSYQSLDSPGHMILEKGEIEELGIKIKARLQWFDLSSHAGRDGLLNIVVHYRHTLKNIVIIHGEDSSRNYLANKIREELGDDINIYTPSNGETITVEA